MRRSKVGVFVHVVWAAWDRLPLLTEEIERQVHRAIGAACVGLGAEVVAIGGVADHIHLLVRLPATVAIAKLAQHYKGSSAHLVTHSLAPGRFFKWQGAYGAFSVSPHDLDTVCGYIANQKDHHAAGSLIADWEHTSNAE